LETSTKAAARYLKNLYSTYHDWQLVLAAYNCGPGKVNKAIIRAGGKRSFWEIYPYLPRETRGYVPEFIAAAYAFSYCKEHNIDRISASFPLRLDTVSVSRNLHFRQVSDVLSFSIDTLRLLNPQYFRDIVPVNSKKPYVLILPWDQKQKFMDQRDSIYSYQNLHYSNEFQKQSQALGLDANDTKNILHRVKSGESLWIIANKYHTTVNNIKKWNKISGSSIKPGQKLVIYR